MPLLGEIVSIRGCVPLLLKNLPLVTCATSSSYGRDENFHHVLSPFIYTKIFFALKTMIVIFLPDRKTARAHNVIVVLEL